MAISTGLSEEFVQDSSSDSESHTTKRKHVDLESKKTKQAVNDHMDQSSTSGLEDSDGDSSDAQTDTSTSSSSNGVKRKSPGGSKPLEPSSKKTKISKAQPSHIPSRSYEPPQGYEPITSPDSDKLSMLSAANLKSKQIWHITAPASGQITTIKSFDLQAALRGEPILEHNGTKYSMHIVPTKTDNLLISTGSDATYVKADVPVTRSLSLREMTQVKSNVIKTDKSQPTESQEDSSNTEISIEFTASSVGDGLAPRPQVDGLMMRYHPYGSAVHGKIQMGNPDVDDEDNNEVASANVDFQAPPNMSSGIDFEEEPQTPKKDRKSKRKDKQKTPKASQEVHKDEDTMDIDLPARRVDNVESLEKKRRKKERREKSR